MSAAYVTIGEEQISQNLLAEVLIEQRLNEHWTCDVRYRAVLDSRPAVEELQGQTIKVSTFSLLGVESVIFSGVVTEAMLTYEVWGSYTAEIKATSRTWLMDRSPRYKYFLKTAPDAIAAELAGNYSLTVDGSIAGDANLSRVQWAESDYSFVLRLVDDAEAWLRPAASSNGIEVRTAFEAGPTLTWREGEYGLNELTTRGRLRPVTAAGAHYDPNVMISALYGGASSEPTFYASLPSMVAAAQGGGVQASYIYSRTRAVTQADYQARLALESRRGQVNAVEVIGISRSPEVCAGNEVTISGMGDESDGTYGVIACSHRWTREGYENTFTATPAKRWFAAKRVVAPEVEGIYAARVVDHNDPHNQGRIRVQYFWQEENETTWVRWLTPHAGPDRGFVMFPEIGDLVLVGFDAGDPERPVALGSAWSSPYAPPSEGFWQAGTNGGESQTNEIKRLVTKSGHRISLSDHPGQPSIAFATPVSSRILLTEADNETGTPSIALDTRGDIILSAPNGRIHRKSHHSSRDVGK